MVEMVRAKTNTTIILRTLNRMIIEHSIPLAISIEFGHVNDHRKSDRCSLLDLIFFKSVNAVTYETIRVVKEEIGKV